MTEIFDPGEPLDISKLNEMSASLTKLSGQLEAFTAASASLQNSTNSNFIVRAGSTGQDLTPEPKKDKLITISFGYKFKISPFVVITPYGVAANKPNPLEYYIGGNYGVENFNLHYYPLDDEWTGGKIGFNWVAVGLPV